MLGEREQSNVVERNGVMVEGLEGFEFQTIASTEEEARLNAQDAFPHGRVRAVYERLTVIGLMLWANVRRRCEP